MNETTQIPKVGRNEPCPCGSGKKYKRCHGPVEAPVASAPLAAAPSSTGGDAAGAMTGMGGMPAGMDPKAMWEMAKVLRRLPKGQVIRLQGLVQQAMAGKDVSREAAELQASLPPDVQQLFLNMSAQAPTGEVAPGLTGEPNAEAPKKKGLFSKIFK